jgi:phosphoserine aminotransferase
VVASDKANAYRNIPELSTWQRAGNAAYLHYTSNETIHGVDFANIPEAGDVPLVADFSSNFLARPVDVNRFGMIYAGAQKNIGPAGITIAVIRKELLGRHERNLPPIFEWQNQAKNDSMFNTPPTFPWYVVGLVLKWMIAEGGTEVFARRNADKAGLLYRTIDGSGGFYRNEVAVAARSTMNVPFMLKDEALDKAFLAESEATGLMGLKGHRALGGMRASIYNAMPLSGVQALADFMRDFAVRHG